MRAGEQVGSEADESSGPVGVGLMLHCKVAFFMCPKQILRGSHWATSFCKLMAQKGRRSTKDARHVGSAKTRDLPATRGPRPPRLLIDAEPASVRPAEWGGQGISG